MSDDIRWRARGALADARDIYRLSRRGRKRARFYAALDILEDALGTIDSLDAQLQAMYRRWNLQAAGFPRMLFKANRTTVVKSAAGLTRRLKQGWLETPAAASNANLSDEQTITLALTRKRISG